MVDANTQEFSFGGEADSTYEYFLKEFILLGGTKDQYRNMYVNSVDAAHEYLFYRPLVEGDPEIMFSGKFRTRYADDGSMYDGELVPEMQHLVPLLEVRG
jgi:mannosyl-oligosaccharide alpha-1,2-mannosidase